MQGRESFCQPFIDLCFCQEPDEQAEAYCEPARAQCFCGDYDCEPCINDGCWRYQRTGCLICCYSLCVVPIHVSFFVTCCWCQCCKNDFSEQTANMRRPFGLICLAFTPCCYPRDGRDIIYRHFGPVLSVEVDGSDL